MVGELERMEIEKAGERTSLKRQNRWLARLNRRLETVKIIVIFIVYKLLF